LPLRRPPRFHAAQGGGDSSPGSAATVTITRGHLTNGGAGRLRSVSQKRLQEDRPAIGTDECETIAGLYDDDGRLPQQEPECGDGALEARSIGRPLNTDRELMARMARGDEAAFTLLGRN